ncbi:MAG: EamA family transporter RarD [Polyangiaceae bacterium]|nr:EamA family transporter RarD [Polyangiaceae bacterium]
MNAAPRDPGRDGGGVVYAVLAYGSWGLVPLFWKLLEGVGPLEILAHRIAWSLLLVIVLLVLTGGARSAMTALKTRRTVLLFLASSALIAVNWGLFILAVMTHRLADASLGYFINPLANVVLGVVVLGEKLARLQKIAVGLAALAVVFLLVAGGSFPWLAFALAGTFAIYGLLRKLAPLESIAGLFVETLVLTPVALAAIVWFESHGGAFSRGDQNLALLLAACGPITALPLVWFAAAARRLPLSTLGLFQYLAPSLQLLVAVFVFRESVPVQRFFAFGLVWAALAIHTVHLLRNARVARA